MTEPGSQDDSWDELARELGLDKSPSPADKAAPAARSSPTQPPADDPGPKPSGEDRPGRGHRRREEPEPVAASADVEDVGFPEGETEAFAEEAELEQDDSEEGDAEGEPSTGEGQAGEGQPGGRKRRRRRRRRKKGGAAPGTVEPAEAVEAGEEPGAGDELEEPAVPTVATARPRRDEGRPSRDEVRPRRDEVEEAGADEQDWDTEEEPGAVPLAAEEDTGGEVLRDLIANWNVPSWDQIVTGLYRPER